MLIKFTSKTFSKWLFETSLCLKLTLFIAFYQQKASKNEMLKQFGVSTNEIYQEGFLKVPALNRSTKGAKISSFRWALCL